MPDIIGLLSFGPEGWGDQIALGLWLTVKLAVFTVPFGLVLGFLLALAKNSSIKELQISSDIFTTIFRGLPELLTLFIIYYGGQILLQQIVSMVSGAYVEINGFIAGMIALGLVFAAYSSEVFLGAFRGIPAGQFEGASALGLTRFQVMRLVILPQLIRLALPGLSNLWLILVKETSLVSVIALSDLMRQVNIAARNTKEPFLFYSLACLIYLGLAIVSSIALSAVDRRVNRGATSER